MQEIEISDLSFVYENRADPALEKLNLSVGRHEFVLLAGASGSGKSTLLKCINGLIPHRYVGEYSGDVKIRGQSVSNSRFLQLSLIVGTVLQEADKQLVSSIVEDDVAFGPGNLALPREEIDRRVKYGLESMDILGLRERSIFAISGGQKQKLAIADVLVMEPDILLFDEPLANLDSNGVRLMQSILRTLHASGKTIIVAEHRTEEVLKADPTRVVVIDKGRMMADSTDPKVLVKFRNVIKVPAEYFLNGQIRETISTTCNKDTRPSTTQISKELIRIEGMSFEYSGGIKALSDINLRVDEGERIALLGNNGAGKSTLALSLIGLLKPTSGQVFIRGQDTRGLSTSEIARSVCLVFQSPFSMLFAKTVREELSFGPKNLGLPLEEIEKIVPETASRCSISHLIDNSPFASSFGEKKRICVGSVLTMQPRCIILDEPTAGQDYRSYSNFMNFIIALREHVKSFVIITHDPDLAIEYADRAIILSNGRVIADGPTRKVLADPDILRQGAIRETSLIELSMKATGGKSILTLEQLTKEAAFASS
ncbi:MAG TPA: ABC transporter ATP-binding protein [Candidatus Acidoferrales bacterium]|nr:ABC transporter ATP-binding protein [Candidatus Acidoferrales bacterium]